MRMRDVHYCEDCADWWQHECDDNCYEVHDWTCPLHGEEPRSTGASPAEEQENI